MKRFLIGFFAFALGILPGFFLAFKFVFTDSSGAFMERLITYVLMFVTYFILAFIFGYISPKQYLLSAILISIPGILLLLLYSIKETNVSMLSLSYGIDLSISSYIGSYSGFKLAKRKK